MEHRLGGMGNLVVCHMVSPSKPTQWVHTMAEDPKVENPTTVGLPHQRRPTRSTQVTILKLIKHPGRSPTAALATRRGHTHLLPRLSHRLRQHGPQKLDHRRLLHRRLVSIVPTTANVGDSTTSTRITTPPLPILEIQLR